MYTLDDKNYLSFLKENNKNTYENIMHLWDDMKSNVQKGCHDIRNILALIIGNIGLFELNHPELENDSHFKLIKEDIQYLSTLMREINKARYAHVISKTEFNYKNLVDRISCYYPMSINVSYDCELTTINADKSGIEYILRALLNNILEENPDSNVTISVSVKNSLLYTSVSDDLPKLDDDIRVNLFHMFNTNKQEHSGLSLATANLILISHDGSIDYSYDNGNTFTFFMKI